MIASNDNLLCKQAKDFYYNYLMNDSKDEVPVKLIEHMDLCPYCKSSMDELQIQLAAIEQNADVKSQRDALTLECLELHYNYINKPVSCNSVKPFLPNLADHALAVHVATPITVHIDNCQQCSENLKAIGDLSLTHKQLCILGQVYAQKTGSDHEISSKDLTYLEDVNTAGIEDIPAEVLKHLTGILEREESNVITVFKADESGQEDVNLPISVEVFDKEKDKIPSEIDSLNINTESTAQAEKAPWRFKPFIKPMATAAAILLMVLLTFKGSVLQAVDLNQIYKALAKVKNVHIVKYDSQTSEPINEIWISQSLNIRILKSSDKYTLWDINNKEFKSKEIGSGSTKIVKFSNDMVDKIKSTMNTPWDLLPFTSVADIPVGAVWEQVGDTEVLVDTPQIEVYDLIWSERMSKNNLVFYKRRIFVDTITHLPHKFEFWEKQIHQDEFELTDITKIDYPDNSQIHQIIGEFGFSL